MLSHLPMCPAGHMLGLTGRNKPTRGNDYGKQFHKEEHGPDAE